MFNDAPADGFIRVCYYAISRARLVPANCDNHNQVGTASTVREVTTKS